MGSLFPCRCSGQCDPVRLIKVCAAPRAHKSSSRLSLPDSQHPNSAISPPIGLRRDLTVFASISQSQLLAIQACTSPSEPVEPTPNYNLPGRQKRPKCRRTKAQTPQPLGASRPTTPRPARSARTKTTRSALARSTRSSPSTSPATASKSPRNAATSCARRSTAALSSS